MTCLDAVSIIIRCEATISSSNKKQCLNYYIIYSSLTCFVQSTALVNWQSTLWTKSCCKQNRHLKTFFYSSNFKAFIHLETILYENVNLLYVIWILYITNHFIISDNSYITNIQVTKLTPSNTHVFIVKKPGDNIEIKRAIYFKFTFVVNNISSVLFTLT